MSDKDHAAALLAGAYALNTPQDNIDYYADFAAIYDTEFVTALGYVYHDALAARFSELAVETDAPILDIGCGTGLVGCALGPQTGPIDGVDISAEMIKEAHAKSVYRNVFNLDLSGPLAALGRYGAFVSAGSFTHGHLGPDVLIRLLDHLRPSGLALIGVNAEHYADHGFKQCLDDLSDSGRITALNEKEVHIYATDDPDYRDATALLVSFRIR